MKWRGRKSQAPSGLYCTNWPESPNCLACRRSSNRLTYHCNMTPGLQLPSSNRIISQGVTTITHKNRYTHTHRNTNIHTYIHINTNIHRHNTHIHTHVKYTHYTHREKERAREILRERKKDREKREGKLAHMEKEKVRRGDSPDATRWWSSRCHGGSSA